MKQHHKQVNLLGLNRVLFSDVPSSPLEPVVSSLHLSNLRGPPWQCRPAMLCIVDKVFQDDFCSMKVLIQWNRLCFYRMISAGNEPFAGSSIGPQGWQCEISMLRLWGESSRLLTFHLDGLLCGEACVALFCSATGCAGPASAFNWADECEARLMCL